MSQLSAVDISDSDRFEMGGYDSLEQLQQAWNAHRPNGSTSLGA